MPGIHRVGDYSIGICDHGQDCCPHTWVGIRVEGAGTVYANGSRVARINDLATTTCPHCGVELAVAGMNSVQAEGVAVHPVNGAVIAPGGSGISISASKNVSGEDTL